MTLETVYERIRTVTSDAEVQRLEAALGQIVAAALEESEYWERYAARVRRNCAGALEVRRMDKEFASLQARVASAAF